MHNSQALNLGQTGPRAEVHSSFPTRRPCSPRSTPELSANSEADRSWKKSATEAFQISGNSTVTSIPTAAMPQPPAPVYSTPQPCTRYGMNTTENEMQP